MTSLEDRAHRNLVDFNRFLGRLERGAQVLDSGGIVAVRGAADFPSARDRGAHVQRVPRR